MKHYFKIDAALKKNLKASVKGIKAYKSIMQKANKESLIILFPSLDVKLNYWGLLYLDEYLMRRGRNKVVIITCDSLVKKNASMFSSNIENIIEIPKEIMEQILIAYAMTDFADLTIISLDKPEGRNASSLVGINGITLEMAVAIGIYFLIPFRSNSSPISYESFIKGDYL